MLSLSVASISCRRMLSYPTCGQSAVSA
ncbi:MAG: hypothetical protein FJ026_08935 [Chloroflexi bacterium]|nr:hypothetical protein [Chloroflexota bacterium]